MGFKIRHKLRGKEGMTLDDVIGLVRQFHALAKSIGCEHPRIMMDWSPSLNAGYAYYHRTAEGLVLPADPDDPNAESLEVSPTSECVMLCEPGVGTESFGIGLAHVPKTVRMTAGPGDWGIELPVAGGRHPWAYTDNCKTGLPDPNKFIAAHLRTIVLLDAAVAAGLQVRVCDDGGYWEHRHVDALLWSHAIYSVVPAHAARVGKELPAPSDRPRRYTQEVRRLVEMTGGTLQGPCMLVQSQADLNPPYCDHVCGWDPPAVEQPKGGTEIPF